MFLSLSLSETSRTSLGLHCTPEYTEWKCRTYGLCYMSHMGCEPSEPLLSGWRVCSNPITERRCKSQEHIIQHWHVERFMAGWIHFPPRRMSYTMILMLASHSKMSTVIVSQLAFVQNLSYTPGSFPPQFIAKWINGFKGPTGVSPRADIFYFIQTYSL